MLLRPSLCTLFMLIIQLWCISCEHRILITLNSLEIDGNLDNGQPCNPYRDAGVNCAPRPKICIEPWFDSDPSPDFCTYRTFIDLGILNVNSSNIFTFDTTSRPVYGAWINPNVIKFVNDYHGFFVKMQIYNADRTNYQLIEKFYWPISESLNGVENGTADSSIGPNAGNFKTKVKLTWWTNNTVANITSTTPSLLRTTITTPGRGGVSAESTIAVSDITEAAASGPTDTLATGTTTTPGVTATAADSGSTDNPPTGTTTTPGEIPTAASGSTDTPLTGTTTGGTTDTLPTPTIAETTEANINTEATESSTLSASSP